MGGAVGVKVNSNGDAAALQNYFATTKPYDFSWRSAMGPWAGGMTRPNNVTSELGEYATSSISNTEAGAVFFKWVMGSNEVQQYTNNLRDQSTTTGNEAFGLLAWDSVKNQYVMLNATDVKATPENVSGTMPTLSESQISFFGMHTHSEDSSNPSLQDFMQTQKLGVDQVIIGRKSTSSLFYDSQLKVGNDKNFNFELLPEAHYRDTREGLIQMGVPADEADRLAKAAVAVDEGTQSGMAFDTNQHGMIGKIYDAEKGEFRTQTAEETKAAIDKMMQEGSLANRLHYASGDWVSHHYLQPWEGVTLSEAFSIAEHVFRDFIGSFFSSETTNESIERVKKAYADYLAQKEKEEEDMRNDTSMVDTDI
jgi:hypothetical protein